VPVLGSGPPFDLRPEAGGLAGAGVSFLALPDSSTVYQIGVHWDLTSMPAGARGVFSRGEGDVSFPGPADLLAYAFYLAGPVASYPPCPNGDGPFQAFWLSQPPFDIQSVVSWTEQAYSEISTFFRDPEKPYFVFFRHNEGGAIGGAALPSSFMVGYGDVPAPTPARLRSMLAHEIVHNWPSPLNDNASEWYGEGMAEHYSAAITLRAGLISPEEFLTGLNAQALSYYANPLRNLPSSEVAARFWSDTRVRNIPYDRGALYLASVDAAVRGSSMGARSLDDLMFSMLDRMQGGQSYDSAAWSALVNRELGAEGRTQYEAMIAGELIEPPSNAYGPCFSNEATSYPQFELGFDPAVLSEVPRIVTEVVPGSNAEQAGLRTGDEITAPIVLEDVLSDSSAQLTVKVLRGTDAMDISYVPRGAAVSGYRWTRVAGVPDSDCAL
jgi:predicted metalloprotease with PDZ domain